MSALWKLCRSIAIMPLLSLALAVGAVSARVVAPIASCATLSNASLGENVTVLSAESASTSGVSYCLVKVLVAPAINIWVGLPSTYNDRFMALGGGGFVGSVSEPTDAVKYGYAGATTDTGHEGSSGSFGMLEPGKPDEGLQIDFGWRSEHMMAVVSKQLIQLFYGRQPTFSYWNGCSTGGRQGQAMAQRFPEDYDGILAGAPAVHFEKLGLGQTWPQVPMLMENDGIAISSEKLARAVAAAVEACDDLDGIKDGVLRDPRACNYSASALVGTTLSAQESVAVDKIWHGPTNADGSLSWYGIPRGASFGTLAASKIFSIADGQGKYWVEFDPDWDYRTLTYDNFAAFYDKTVEIMGPGPTPTDNAESIGAFRDRGGKMLMWHGWADQIIPPQGTIDLYNAMVNTSDGGDATRTREWMRLFMAPGVAHCGLASTAFFEALVAWVEEGVAPETLTHQVSSTTTRPLCPHPKVAVYKGVGSTDDEANFVCGDNLPSVTVDTEDANTRVNMRLFGKPFVPSPPCPGCA